jgi:hypothetical protein
MIEQHFAVDAAQGPGDLELLMFAQDVNFDGLPPNRHVERLSFQPSSAEPVATMGE